MLDLLCLMFDNLLMSKKESLREQIAKAKENFSQYSLQRKGFSGTSGRNNLRYEHHECRVAGIA